MVGPLVTRESVVVLVAGTVAGMKPADAFVESKVNRVSVTIVIVSRVSIPRMFEQVDIRKKKHRGADENGQ